MILCSIGHGEFPDLNFRLAPSCHIKGKQSILLMNKPLKLSDTTKAFKPVYFFENIMAGPQSIIPKKGEIKILQNNNDNIDGNLNNKNVSLAKRIALLGILFVIFVFSVGFISSYFSAIH